MTLEQVFYVTQSLAAVGVIASLIFLGLQTKDNARAVRAATTQAVQGDYTAWYRLLAEHPEILAVLTKGYASPSALSGDEKRLFFVTLQIVVFNAQNAFTQWHNGHLPEDVWTTYEKGLGISMRTPGGLMFWHERRWLFGNAFQAEVDAAISRPMDPEAKSIFAMPGANIEANPAAHASDV
jgi:hypothetical protein